jgi:hypothetical protein
MHSVNTYNRYAHANFTCIHAALSGGAAAKLTSANRAHMASAKQLSATAPLLRARKGLRLRAVTPPDADATASEQQEAEEQSAPKLSLEDDDEVLT